jgi:basic membrane protein A
MENMNKKSKWFGLLILLALLVSACGGGATPVPQTAAPTEPPAAETEPPAAEEPFRVAVVMPSAINDLAFSQSMYDALAAIQTEMGADNFEFAHSENMFVVDDAAAALRDYASQGYDLVIAHGSQYGSSVQEIAPDFPDTSFAWGTTVDTFAEQGIDNVYAYEARSEQGGYVNGVIAASLSESGTLGVVGPIETGDAKLYVDGFKAGAEATKPDISVNINYIGSFSDVALASEAARTHINAGADGMTGTAQMVVGAIGVAEEAGVPWFGTQSSQTSLAPTIVVANQVYDWTVVLNDIIGKVKGGQLGGESFAATLANGGLKMDYNPDYELPAEVKALADETVQGIIDGTIVVGEAPPAEATEEPTEAPLVDIGTEANPIVWVLVPSQDTQAVLTGAEDIAAAIEEQTGLIVEPLVTTDFTGAVEAMCSGEAHIGALNTFNYVLAHERGCADVALASERFGTTFYQGQVITRADSGITSVADLAGKTFCRPDPTSTSGWIIPSITMQAEGIDPETDLGEIIDAGGHDAVVISVYNGDCEAGATFLDARTNVEADFPDVMEQIVVIAESVPIPNDTISFQTAVPAEIREQVVGVFLDLAATEEGLATLNTVYSWSGMQEVDDSFYDGFRQQLEAAGINIEELANP